MRNLSFHIYKMRMIVCPALPRTPRMIWGSISLWTSYVRSCKQRAQHRLSRKPGTPWISLLFFGRHPWWLIGKQSCKCRRCGFRSLGQEDPLEKEMATHSSALAWEIPWTEEPGRLQSMGLQRVGHDLATKQQSLLPAWSPGQLPWFESGPLLHMLSFIPSWLPKANTNEMVTG